MDKIIIKGLNQNNLKNIALEIPKKKLVVFTGVSGSGKSSIVFDTIAAEASRQMNETYPAFIRSRLPKYVKPKCDVIENLSPAIVVDQEPIGSNARSTVGTVTELYTQLRYLFSRIGDPYVGNASHFSFNDPNGMCEVCSGLGMVTDINIDKIIDKNKSLKEGAFIDSTLKVGSWYWKMYMNSGLFDVDKPIKDYSPEEYHLLLYGKETKENKYKNIGIYDLYKKRYLNRENIYDEEKAQVIVTQKLCPSCHGQKLNRIALACWINNLNIDDFCQLELFDLKQELLKITDSRVLDIIISMVKTIDAMIQIGLGYLHLSRTTNSLSGGEAQRVKLVKYLGSSLTDMIYIFDEPSSGMHPRDVYRMNNLLLQLRDKGNTVLVVEHDKDVISIADEVIDVGPLAGINGGEIVYQGTYDNLLKAETLTGLALNKNIEIKTNVKRPKEFLVIEHIKYHNLKDVSVKIPLNVITVITGVAGSGKSSLMTAFSEKYADKVIKVDQKPITATGRSTPASYLGFMDEIRKVFASANNMTESMFSFNSLGACPHCKGKGVIVTELAYMDPIVTNCEACNGTRYASEVLTYKYQDRNIIEVLAMTVKEALNFFDNKKILEPLKALDEVGLSYLTLGQPTSTLSGGERQRLKLAYNLKKKGSIYLLDEPTTVLHQNDIDKIIALFNKLVDKGNTVIIIEHNLEVIKQADYIIDIGPDGGKNGGQVVFTGTPLEMLSCDTITAKCLKANVNNKKLSEKELQELIKVNIEVKEDIDMGKMKLNPIGRIENEYGEFKLVLNQQYKVALKGLEGFSHIQVIWWFDGCDNEDCRNQLVNDKPYKQGPELLGTFATRSPARPNPIAITVCQVASIDYEKGIINLYYIDALHGTPLLDIKPYTPSLDKVYHYQVPTWCRHWPNSLEENDGFDWEKEFNFKQE